MCCWLELAAGAGAGAGAGEPSSEPPLPSSLLKEGIYIHEKGVSSCAVDGTFGSRQLPAGAWRRRQLQAARPSMGCHTTPPPPLAPHSGVELLRPCVAQRGGNAVHLAGLQNGRGLRGMGDTGGVGCGVGRAPTVAAEWAGWWEWAAVNLLLPRFLVPRKNCELRTNSHPEPVGGHCNCDCNAVPGPVHSASLAAAPRPLSPSLGSQQRRPERPTQGKRRALR